MAKRAPEYDCWAKMIQRCTNPRAKGYRFWGGRGIGICQRWRDSYAAFFADMGQRPSSQHSIDRINNNGDYEPANCRWVLRRVQNRNRRYSRLLTWNDRTMRVSEWAELLNMDPKTLEMRVLRGWPVERALTEPLGVGRRMTQLGTTKPGCGWFGDSARHSKVLKERHRR